MNLSTSHIAMSDRKSCRKKLYHWSFLYTAKSFHGQSGPYLRFSRALQYVHQRTGHLLFAFDAQHRLQHSAHGAVIIGDVLCKLLIQLHGQDVHGLEAGFKA